MANVVFSSDDLNIGGVPDKLNYSNKDFESFEGGSRGKQSSFMEQRTGERMEALIPCLLIMDSIEMVHWRKDSVSPNIGHSSSNDSHLQIMEVAETKKEKQYPFSLSSLGLLNNYGSGFKRLQGERRSEGINDITAFTKEADRKLSTEEIMRVAGEMFIESSCRTIDNISMLDHPFNLSFSGLSYKETKDVELVM
ncbi:hypothetical protein CRYUN_Cryun18bG0007200 [Craigia yunnanensis]